MNFPPLPDMHALLALALTAVALYLFRREDLQLETSCLAVLIILAALFEFFPYEGPLGKLDAVSVFQGFGNEALITICALIMAGEGLSRTGALEPVGRFLGRLWRFSPALAFLFTLVATTAISPFINNVPLMIVMMPVLIAVSLRAGTGPGKLLLPVNHANILGGLISTIGTSTNLLVINVAAQQGVRELHMFEFWVPGTIMASIGVFYLWLVAPRLLPARHREGERESVRLYTAQLRVTASSFCAGRTLGECTRKTGELLKVSRIQRGEDITVMPVRSATLLEGDRLLVHDSAQNLKELENILGVTLDAGDAEASDNRPQHDDQQLAEVVVTANSLLDGSTLKTVAFQENYGLTSLALHRRGEQVHGSRKTIADEKLIVGDVLLVQGSPAQMTALKKRGDLLVLDGTLDLPRSSRASLALLIMAGVVTVAAAGLLPIAIAALCGVLLMVATRCVTWDEAAQGLSMQVILVMATSLALGTAILNSGGADWLAKLFVALSFGAPDWVMLSGLMLLIAIFTNVVDNNAAAVIGTPIAVGIAHQLGADPIPFVIAVIFGANLCLATPFAYKTNILIWSAGNYTFGDYMRLGLPLMLLMWLLGSVLLPMFFPL